MAARVLLAGFAFTGFRSFGGDQLQRVGPMDRVHLVAGPNNSGKSSVLAVAQHGLSALRGGQVMDIEPVDLPLSAPRDRTFRIAVARPLTREDIELLIQGRFNLDPAVVLRLLEGATFRDGSDLVWFEFEVQTGADGRPAGFGPSQAQLEDVRSAAEALAPQGSFLQAVSSALTGTSGGAPLDDPRRILGRLAPDLGVTADLPPVVTIPAFRQIGPGQNDVLQDGYHGPGLIERLARLQNPAFDAADDKRRFDDINRFVATLFDDDATFLEVPHDRKTILIHHEGRRLPLENYGTGLHEVVILAAAATVLSRHLICIEEPEVHLHPTLQRKLLHYLSESTDNQYLLATHSPHLLDAARASITAVSITRGESTVSQAITPRDIAAIASELGLRASDLVQANAVIWVEGPSDRVYVRYWISQIDSSLIEGIHYSIMFYGGSLLRHLSPDDPSVEDFVSLPRLNRNFAVIIDSDRASSRARINDTKKRVRDAVIELSETGFCWITKGYTIENYVPPATLIRAVAKVHPRARCTWDGDSYANPLSAALLDGRNTHGDKTSVALAAVADWPTDDAWPHDLRSQVKRLVEMVQAANDS